MGDVTRSCHEQNDAKFCEERAENETYYGEIFTTLTKEIGVLEDVPLMV